MLRVNVFALALGSVVRYRFICGITVNRLKENVVDKEKYLFVPINALEIDLAGIRPKSGNMIRKGFRFLYSNSLFGGSNGND